MASTFEEDEKLGAAGALPKPYQRLVWDDLLCRRADAIHARNIREDEDVADQQLILSTPTPFEQKLKTTIQRVFKDDDDIRE